MQPGQKANPWVNVGEYLQANKPYQQQYESNMGETYAGAMQGLQNWQSDIAKPVTRTAMTTGDIKDVSGIQSHADAGVVGGWDAYRDKIKTSLTAAPAAPSFTPDAGSSDQKAEQTFSMISETPTVENIVSGFRNLSGALPEQQGSVGGQKLDDLIMSGTDVSGIANPYIQQFGTWQDDLANLQAQHKTAGEENPLARQQTFANVQEVMGDLEQDNVVASEIDQYNALRETIGLEPIEAYKPDPNLVTDVRDKSIENLRKTKSSINQITNEIGSIGAVDFIDGQWRVRGTNQIASPEHVYETSRKYGSKLTFQEIKDKMSQVSDLDSTIGQGPALFQAPTGYSGIGRLPISSLKPVENFDQVAASLGY